MKVVFFTSVLNHHQLPFCLEMYKALGRDFAVITTMEMEAQREGLGYQDMIEEVPFGLKMHADTESYQRAYALSQESDVLIAGVIPPQFVFDRMKRGKLTFRYSERFYKSGFWRVLSPRALLMAYRHHFRYRKDPLYLLCASAYVAYDATRILSYPNKMYKWGYFPEFREHDIENLLRNKGTEAVTILWAGRFLEWKQPEYALYVAQHLTQKGIACFVEMIGTGPTHRRIVQMARDLGVTETISFAGALSPQQVRRRMEKADLVLCTSNSKEGWGVVVNEAMNSGCAVVANRSMGSVPFLIEDGISGLVFKDKDIVGLCESVDKLVMDVSLRRQMACNAYKAIERLWNPTVATGRLLAHIESLLCGADAARHSKGPMSMAEVIR